MMRGLQTINDIESMYVNNLACERINGGEKEWFRIDNWKTRVSCPCAFQCVHGKGDERELK